MNVGRKGKKQLRIHHTLSNGQNITMFVSIVKYNYHPTPYIVAKIGLAISPNRNKRYCNDWYAGKRNKRSVKLRLKETGMVGLEGLLWAKQTLIELEPYLLLSYSLPIWIKVGWANNQRAIVYSRLRRHEYYYTNWYGEDCLCKELRSYPVPV